MCIKISYCFLIENELRSDLDSRIDSFTTGKAADDVALKQIIDEVQELRKNVNDEAWTLPSHDQRSYEIVRAVISSYPLNTKVSSN